MSLITPETLMKILDYWVFIILVKMEGNNNSLEWKEKAIMKLLFPSTPFISDK